MPRKAQDQRLADSLMAAGNGDREALRQIYLATAGQLYALAIRITESRTGAEDVLQEVFIKVWNRAAGFDPERADAMAWLATITRNAAIDWYRAHRRHIVVGDDSAILLVEDDAELVEDRMIRQDLQARALQHLGDLPASQESEIRQAFFQGLTYAQLADAKGLPLSTLKSRIRRTLTALRAKIDHD